MIDIHCHILPGIDDGPQSLEISLAMAQAASQDGIKGIIATPHTDGIRVNSTTVSAGVSHFTSAIQKKQIDISIFSGYEIPASLAGSLAAGHTLAGSRYVLVEFPHTHIPPDALAIITSLLGSDLVPIIAHPERNPDILFNPDILGELVDAGALAQLTAVSLLGELGPDIERCSHYLLKNNFVHFIATDSHSPTFRRPVLSRARKLAARIIGQEKADKLVLHNPLAIVENSKNELR